MKVLLTGITGNVGSAVYPHLLNKEVEIIAGVRNISKYHDHFPKEIELRPFDFMDESTYEKALDGVDKVFLVRPPQISDYKVINHFIDVAIEKGVNHVVFLSLMGIEKNPFPPHYKIEKHLKQVNCDYTFLRPSFFMQNLLEVHLEDIQKHQDLFIPSKKARLSFIDTTDIGEVAMHCLLEDSHRNKAYTLTGKEALHYDDVANIMTKELGVQITYSNPSLLKFRKVMLKRGYKKDYVNVMLFLNIMTRLNTAKHVTEDVKDILKKEPKSFSDFVREHKQIFINQKEE